LHRGNVYLDDDRYTALELVSAEQRMSTGELVRRAVDLYLAAYLADEPIWNARFERLVNQIREPGAHRTAPEELETDIAQVLHRLRERRDSAGLT